MFDKTVFPLLFLLLLFEISTREKDGCGPNQNKTGADPYKTPSN